MNEKQEILEKIISEFDSAVVAFSGGVDSTYLAYITYKMFNEKMLAVTIKAPFIPKRELQEALETAVKIGFPLRVIAIENFNNDLFLNNPPDRCYYCKKAVFNFLKRIASEEQIKTVFEGSNADDVISYRPGIKAINELGIRSPLKEAGLSKAEIRELSRKAGLSTADKPSYACLASRFPYGSQLTTEAFNRVEKAEDFLFSLGFEGHRVRDHYPIARIELNHSELRNIFENETACKVISEFKKLGYRFVTVDLEGYRSGCFDSEYR